jgi:hypothetical protein
MLSFAANQMLNVKILNVAVVMLEFINIPTKLTVHILDGLKHEAFHSNH